MLSRRCDADHREAIGSSVIKIPANVEIKTKHPCTTRHRPPSTSRNAGIVEPNSRRSEVGKDRGIFMPPSQVGSRDYVLSHSFIWYKYSYPVCSNPILPPSQVGSRDYVLSHSFIWYKYSYPVCSNPILPAPLSNNPIFSSVYKDRKTLIHRENQNLFPPPSPFHWW